MTGSSTSGSNTQAEYYAVETCFEKLKEYLTGDTFLARCFLEEVTELFFKYTICVFGFLFLTKLYNILRCFATFIYAMLAGRIVLFRENFIGAIDSFAKFTSDFGLRSGISCHY